MPLDSVLLAGGVDSFWGRLWLSATRLDTDSSCGTQQPSFTGLHDLCLCDMVGAGASFVALGPWLGLLRVVQGLCWTPVLHDSVCAGLVQLRVEDLQRRG
jgi:hypothetical protein